MHKYDVLVRPVTTEKTDRLNEKFNQVAFEVATDANKRQIREAVQSIFSVRVTAVRTMVMPGKGRRWGRHLTQTPKWKKAVITLAKGDSIDLVE